MGDRGTVEVRSEGKSVYLYTHWRGSELLGIVHAAINSKNGRRRWGDAAYLARIIFDHMTEGDRDAETGFGISAWPCDGIEIVVDVDNKEIDGLPFGSVAPTEDAN